MCPLKVARKSRPSSKLESIANEIGYPDKWRDYSKVRIVRDDLFGDTLFADDFEVQRQITKIDKPVNRMEFHMTPPTVFAYYKPLREQH